MKKEPDSKLFFAVNGHELSGEKRKGKWTFTCPDWPELAEERSGDDDMTAMVSAFMKRALQGAITVRQLTERS